LKFERVYSSTLDLPKSCAHSPAHAFLAQRQAEAEATDKELGYRGEILFVGHHLSHAAGCFL
jgi:predicted NodU family carbamoyl transferase